MDQGDYPVLTANKSFLLGYTNDSKVIYSNVPAIIFDDFTLESRYIEKPFSVRSSAVKILNVKDNNSLFFVFCLLQQCEFTLLGHARHYVRVVQNTSVPVPEIPEQKKIASLLSSVDETLALCQRKLELLTQAKKALMQQIFSQKLRFKADDGSDFPDWEKKRIGDVAFQLKKSIDPRNIPDQLFYEYSMPAFDEKKEPHLSYGYEMASSRKILDQSCLLINKLNVRKQRIWLVSNPQENAVSSAEFVPLSSRQVNLKFLNYLALSDRFTAYLMDSSSGSSNSQKRVTPDVIEDYEAAFPSLPEQQKIADCLSSADTLIDQARAELEQWQEVKKSLLQQMFV